MKQTVFLVLVSGLFVGKLRSSWLGVAIIRGTFSHYSNISLCNPRMTESNEIRVKKPLIYQALLEKEEMFRHCYLFQ